MGNPSAEWAEAIAHRGELNLIRGPGSQGVKAGTEERSFLFAAKIRHTQLPPDEYFLQWFVND